MGYFYRAGFDYAAAEHITCSTPYKEDTLAFIVEDHRRADFSIHERLQVLDAPRIAVSDWACT